jgi:hypothetical protein
VVEPLVEIIDVSQESPSEVISAAYIERPIPGTALDRTTIEVGGQ